MPIDPIPSAHVELIRCEPLSGDPARQRADAIDAIAQSLDACAGEALTGCGAPGNRPRDCVLRLHANATLLYDRGLTTPAEVEAWMNSAWRHDTMMAAAQGVIGNTGYAIGMGTATEAWAGKLPDRILSDPSLFGLVVGLAVGAMDVSLSVIGGRAIEARMLNANCPAARMPLSFTTMPPLTQFIRDTMTGAAVNMAKNSSRLLVPVIQNRIQGDPHGRIDRIPSDRIDVALDAGGGILAGVALNVTKFAGQTYQARMALRDDLGDVFRKSQDSWGTAATTAVAGASRGVLSLLDPRKPVPAALVGTVGVFISNLFAANSSIDKTDNAAHAAAGNFTIADDKTHYLTATHKRVSSMTQMGLMTATIPLVAAATDMVFDALAGYMAKHFPLHSARPTADRANVAPNGP